MASRMDMEYTLIQMTAIIKVSIRIIIDMEKVDSIIMMAVTTMVIGLMENKLDMEFTLGKMATSTRAAGTKV